MDNEGQTKSNIQNISTRNKIGERLKNVVRGEVTSEGVSQGESLEEAQNRTRQLESWGELEKSDPLYAAGKNLQTKVSNN